MIRIAILLAAAVVWMGPPRLPGPPGCRGPRPPMPYNETFGALPDAPALAIETQRASR